MANRKTGAQRYNDRMDKIIAKIESLRQQADKNDLTHAGAILSMTNNELK